MAPNICNCLHLALFCLLLCLRLLVLLLFKALCCGLELLFVDHEEVARPTLGKVRLCQDVLDTSDWAHITLFVNVFQLVHLIRLVNDPVPLFEMYELVPRLEWIGRARGSSSSWSFLLLLHVLFTLLYQSLLNLF